MGFRILLDSGLHVADAVTEAPLAAARDVDDEAPLVTAAREGRLAATWAETPDAARAWSGYVMPLALVGGIKEAEPYLAKQLLYSGIVKDLDLT